MSGSAQTHNLPNPAKLALRFLIVSAAVFWLTHTLAKPFAELLLPTLRQLLALFGGDFKILDLDIVRDGPGDVLRLKADVADVIFIGDNAIRPFSDRQGWMQVTLAVGGILQHSAFLLIILLAWPARSMEFVIRVALALPLIGLLIFINLPFTLLAELWFPLHDDYAPDEFWLLLGWSRFLMAGGGLVIAMLLAMAAISVARRFASR